MGSVPHTHHPSVAPSTPSDGLLMISEVLPREPESVPVARRLVRDALSRWQLPRLVEAAELVVSELAANTVNHARADCMRVTVCRVGADRVRVAVIDRSRAMPVLADAGDDTEHGRGLALVDAVSQQWGYDTFRWGKRVWADLVADDEDSIEGQVPMHNTPCAQAGYALTALALGAAIVWSILTPRS
ncbi:ATP-binding protein [Streptomyces sp. NPDC002623]